MKKISCLIILYCLPFLVNALEVVPHVELPRYIGRWYEIARFDAWFERGCTSVTAEYSLNIDGHINVVNSCHLQSPDGVKKTSYGRARVVDAVTNAKLRVSFLPTYLSWFDNFFSGDYWILKLEADYSVALVGDNSKKYLWILSRKPQLAPEVYAQYIKAAQELGFDTNKLLKTQQSE